jgi:hypothetical protein
MKEKASGDRQQFHRKLGRSHREAGHIGAGVGESRSHLGHESVRLLLRQEMNARVVAAAGVLCIVQENYKERWLAERKRLNPRCIGRYCVAAARLMRGGDTERSGKL